jgi:hypothetical protein
VHLFERRVVARVAEDAPRRRDARLLRGRALRQAEVEQHDLLARRELQILRLDVAVDDGHLLRVQVVQGVEQLVCPSEHVGDGEGAPALLEHVGEVVAGDVLHDEELPLALGEVVADARQDVMPEVIEEPRLALEGAAQTRVVEEGLFDGDGRAEALVGRDVDGPHAAPPDLLADEVAILQDCVGSDHPRESFGQSAVTKLIVNTE